MSNRIIIQTSDETNRIIEEARIIFRRSNSDVINQFILDSITPYMTPLKRETELLMNYISKEPDEASEVIRSAFVRVISLLREYPLKNSRALEEIMSYYTAPSIMTKRYDYLHRVDIRQDERLRRLNLIIRTMDDDFNIGMRELGTRSKYVFRYWDDLYTYPEVYEGLAAILETEDQYEDITVPLAVLLIKQIDREINSERIAPSKEKFPVAVDFETVYFGLRYELITYETNNGYCSLSGDKLMKNVPEEIEEFFKKVANMHKPFTNVTEQDYEELKAVEQEGQELFRKIRKES